MDEVKSVLEKRSKIGKKKGSHQVWSAATAEVENTSRFAHRPKNRLAFAMSSVAIIASFAVVASVLLWNKVDKTDGSTSATDLSEKIPVSSEETYEETSDIESQKNYLDCVNDKSYDLEFAQVIRSPLGRPIHVKTGGSVPAHIHGPCLASIGGSEIDADSYGTKNDAQDYVACAVEAGTDPKAVDVMYNEQGSVVDVLTAVSVEANVHSECLVKLGGEPTQQASGDNLQNLVDSTLDCVANVAPVEYSLMLQRFDSSEDALSWFVSEYIVTVGAAQQNYEEDSVSLVIDKGEKVVAHASKVTPDEDIWVISKIDACSGYELPFNKIADGFSSELTSTLAQLGYETTGGDHTIGFERSDTFIHKSSGHAITFWAEKDASSPPCDDQNCETDNAPIISDPIRQEENVIKVDQNFFWEQENKIAFSCADIFVSLAYSSEKAAVSKQDIMSSLYKKVCPANAERRLPSGVDSSS